MNNNFQSFIFNDEEDNQFDQPPQLVFPEMYPQTLVRRSFPLLSTKTPRTSFTSTTMIDLQEEMKETPHYMGTTLANGMGIQFDDQLPQIGLNDVDSQICYPPEQEYVMQSTPEEEFKLISFPVQSKEELYEENGKKKEIGFPKAALRWTSEEKQRKYVCINSHQYKTIMRRRQKRKEQSLRSLQILNSATQTINSTTSGVGQKKKYKYESRHTHAQNRVRDKRGKFISKGKATEKQTPTEPYEQEEKQRKSDASLPQWDISKQMEQLGQLESFCQPYPTLPQINNIQPMGTLTNNIHLNFDIRRLGQMNSCSPIHQLDSTKELQKSYSQVHEVKGEHQDIEQGVVGTNTINEITPNGNLNLYNYGFYNPLNVGNMIDVRPMNGTNQQSGNLL